MSGRMITYGLNKDLIRDITLISHSFLFYCKDWDKSSSYHEIMHWGNLCRHFIWNIKISLSGIVRIINLFKQSKLSKKPYCLLSTGPFVFYSGPPSNPMASRQEYL